MNDINATAPDVVPARPQRTILAVGEMTYPFAGIRRVNMVLEGETPVIVVQAQKYRLTDDGREWSPASLPVSVTIRDIMTAGPEVLAAIAVLQGELLNRVIATGKI